jgi:hypothetical protein
VEHRIQSILALWDLKLEALSTQCSILVTLKLNTIKKEIMFGALVPYSWFSAQKNKKFERKLCVQFTTNQMRLSRFRK